MAPQEPQAEKPQIGDRLKAIIDKLNLTQDQIAKIQAMIQQRPKPDEAEVQARVDQIKALLSAPVVDVAALAAHIEHDRQQIHKRLATMVDVVTGIQAILTPEQRAILAKIPPAEDAPQPDITADLDLTDQQKAAIESLRPVAADTSLRKAIHDFMVSGDKAALAKAINDSADRLPSATAIASGLASLSQDQRQKLIDLVAERIEAKKEAVAEKVSQMAPAAQP
jgi:Spy/CpxP family protein refolding chaperone